MGLIEYNPLVEQANAIAYGWKNGHDGAITGATLGATGPGDDLTAMSFDGVNDIITLPAGFKTAADTAIAAGELSIAHWSKVSGAGVWTDGTTDFSIELFVDANNFIRILKKLQDNLWRYAINAGGTLNEFDHAFSSTDWFHTALTIDFDGNIIFYVDGVAVDTSAFSGTFAGSIATALIGGKEGPTNFYNGFMGRVLFQDRVLTPAEVTSLASISP